MSVAQPVRRNSTSYRQGMVLGLTMAETLLLLVFCLLIAAASVFSYKREQLREAQFEKQTLSASLIEANEKIKQMQARLPDGVIADDWDHFLRNYPYIEKLGKEGVSLKEAAEAADIVSAAIQAKKDGATAEDVTKSIALQQAIEDEFSGLPDGVPSNKKLTSFIREGWQVLKGSTKSGDKGKHDWPPIITLSEADGHYFDTGKAVLSDKFRAALSGPIINQLLRIIKDYPDVNVVEVIGHTDEQPFVQRRFSNLDQQLIPVLQRKRNSSTAMLTPADNAGLGLARAVSVSQILLQDERLASRFAILPYSGAQLVHVNNSLVLAGTGAEMKERRRIEIRLRKSNRVGLPIASPLPPAPLPKQKPAATPSLGADEIDTAGGQPRRTVREPVKPEPRREGAPTGANRPFGWFFRN